MFGGLVSFVNNLKPESSSAIKKLSSGGINSVMITGDNFLTAYSISKKSNIIPKKSIFVKVFFKSLDEIGFKVFEDINMFKKENPTPIIPNENCKFCNFLNLYFKLFSLLKIIY